MIDKDAIFIDLTHTLNPDVPTWEYSKGFISRIEMDYSQGCRVQSYEMAAGIGTHMDAPAHFFQDGKQIAEIPLNALIAPCFVIDVSKKAHPDYLILQSDIEEFENTHGVISEGSFVIGNTGWFKKWKNPKKYRNQDRSGKMHFPGFSPEAVSLLLKRKIVGIGIDTLSPDGPNVAFPVHRSLLKADKYIVENLTALDRIPPTGATIILLPLKIDDGTESPIRAVAIIHTLR
jgi:kynurenine formamidase